MSSIRQLGWWPVNALYGAGTGLRRRLYAAGVFRAHLAKVPVISVGNISAGGTGKTPLVMWLADILAREGRNICVISRGYGRPHPDERLLVSDGLKVLAGADEAGDEPTMMAEALLGQAAVLCDRDRVSAAQWAVDTLGTDLIILDDGFQHFRLARAADLVLVDASRPFAGLMRERRPSLCRATAILISRSDLADDLTGLRAALDKVSGGRPVFTMQLQTVRVRRLNAPAAPDGVMPQRVGAFCGVGNPASFFGQVRNEGLDVIFTSQFPDHANYTQPLVDKLCRAALAAGAEGLVTTAKDEVKLRNLRFDLPVVVLDNALVIDNETGLLDLIRDRIRLAVRT